MSIVEKPLSEINQEAITLLSRGLGVANTLRFLSQFTAGNGNYTEEREDMSLEEIFAEARRIQGSGVPR